MAKGHAGYVLIPFFKTDILSGLDQSRRRAARFRHAAP
jgi:hypothetical protein